MSRGGGAFAGTVSSTLGARSDLSAPCATAARTRFCGARRSFSAPGAHWESGDESLDLEAEFRKHFAGGDPRADVPDLIGIAVLTDGDDTHSVSSADFGSFVLRQEPS
jgi:hypothetical protein